MLFKFELLIIFILVLTPLNYSQSIFSVQPTPIPGLNSSEFDYNSQSYKFYHDGNLRYEYSIVSDTSTNGGSFNVLKAIADNGTTFLPSNFGGIRATLDGDTISPYDPGVSFICIEHKFFQDFVVAHWQMKFNEKTFCKYKYKIKIIGRTLIIKLEVDTEYSNNTVSLEIDRCEDAENPEAIAIPYLTLFHVLLSNDIFTSFFTDWEKSNASQLIPLNGLHYPYNNTSVRYSQSIVYNPKTNGERNRMMETLYLTTSPNLEDVFPNIPNPISPYKEVSSNHIVWDYRRPFGRLIHNVGRSGNYLERLWNAGVANIWVQIHDWQNYHGQPCLIDTALKSGYDDGLPCVLPANEINLPGSEFGGPNVLDSVIQIARYQYGYRIGLHQNYVDYYPNAVECSPWTMGYENSDVALNSNGEKIKSFYNGNCTHIQSYLLKPSRASVYVNYWSIEIQKEHPNLNASYLDVHSSLTPYTNYVDYDTSISNAGMFRETLQNYRKLYDVLRKNQDGPVQGEGGNQPFYQGYVDDIEARLITPTKLNPGYNLPLLVDFDLYELHYKTMVHGVGWYPLWMSENLNHPIRPDESQVLSYIATELAYGHGAYLCDEFDAAIDFIKHAQLKYKHVFSVQKDYANAAPIQIEYNDNDTLKSSSDFIRKYPVTYKDISSDDFMSQVKITYDNGVIICVNRHPTRTWTVTVGSTGGWFNYNTISTLDTGFLNTTTFTLPPKNGWVIYDPLKNEL